MRSMVEGYHRLRCLTTAQTGTPLRQAFGLPPPFQGGSK